MVIALLISAAWGASLSGAVLTDGGEPLQGAFVVAFDLRLNYSYTTTSLTGEWTITELPAGQWRLEVIPPDHANRAPRFLPDARGYCDGTLLTVAEDGSLTDLDFSLAEGAQLSGRLIDVAGAPVAGAEVEASGVDDRVLGMSRQAETDADGRFTLNGLDADAGDPTAWTLRVNAEEQPTQYLGGAYEEEDADLFLAALGEERDVGEHSLLPGITVSGTIRGPEGAVEGASVHVYAGGQVVTVSSEADGRYLASALPPGSVLPWAQADGLALTYYPDADRPSDWLLTEAEGEALEGADLDLPQEAIFRTQFLAAAPGETADLSGVTALLYNDTSTVGFGARAEADGTLSIDGLHPGDYRLYVFATEEGYANDYLRDLDGEEKVFAVEGGVLNDVGGLDLPVRARMSGRVVDDAGAPVYGAYVIAWASDGSSDLYADISDRDGAFWLAGLPEGRYTVEARYSPYCEEDPGYVTAWWPGDEVNPDRAATLIATDGDLFEDARFVLPRDDDHDGMGDAWEAENGLDTGRDDSALDPDGDGFTNLDEYLLGTDPQAVADKQRGCGCGSGGAHRAWMLGLPLLGLLRRRRA